MSARSKNRFISLERKIVSDDRAGIVHRWESGRQILADTRGKLTDEYARALCAEAESKGLKLSVREIRFRLQCVRAYKTMDEICAAAHTFDSWWSICRAGFPEVLVDQPLWPDDPDEEPAAHDSWEQLSLIPGFAKVISVRGRRVKLDDATVDELAAYADMYDRMTESYAKRGAEMRRSIDVMLLGSAGNGLYNAVEAYRLGSSAMS